MRPLCLAAVAVLLWLLISPPADAAGATFKFTYIKFDPAGADKPNGEYVQITNVTSKARNLGGYRVRDLAGHRYTFPATVNVGSHGHVTLKSGKGTHAGSTYYWGSGSPIWNNDGDKAYLYWPGKTSIDYCPYSGAGSSTRCGE